jgi:hypothetical protein
MKLSGFTGLSRFESKKNIDNFRQDQMTDLSVVMHNQGYDESTVARILQDPGCMSPDPYHVLDLMFHLKRFPALEGETLAKKLHVSDSLEVAASAGSPAQIAVSKEAICRVCFARPIDIQINPCGHKIICKTCLPSVGKTCPLCRDTISGCSSIV